MIRGYETGSRKNKVLIAAHRGASAGNIPCNTIPAFEAALAMGADILEMDVQRTKDGQFLVYHSGTEKWFLQKDVDLDDMTAEQGRSYPLYNYDGTPTEERIPLLSDVLEHFKGRCLINLDRSWEYWPELLPYLKRFSMDDQLIMKCAPKPEYLAALSELGRDFPYMPICRTDLTGTDLVEKSGVRWECTEVIFFSEDEPICQPDALSYLRRDGKLLFVNCEVYNYKAQLTAGHNDDISAGGRPDEGWGWLADRGYDILQTDWPGLMQRYLHSKGMHE